MIFDSFFLDTIEPPEIPIEFTEEEIKRAKQSAYDKLLAELPELKDDELRKKLPIFEKIRIVETLKAFYEEEVEVIRKEKDGTINNK